MSFADGKPHVVTPEDLKRRWSGAPDARKFRCYLCGDRFQAGETFRFVFGGSRGHINLMVCSKCDGPNDIVVDRWIAMRAEFDAFLKQPKFWRLRSEFRNAT